MKVVIVGCGGFGINRLRDVYAAKIHEQFDDVEYLLIDGTDANIKPEDEVFGNNFWRVPDTQGAGKKRALTAKQYIEFLSENFSRIPKADMYVIVYSLSGGSGSVLGPELNRRLMTDDRNTVNVVLATNASREDAKNTFNTLQGLANNVQKIGRPIHFMIEESGAGTRSEVDAMINDHIFNVSSICGVHHHGLDANDVKSFLDYQRHDVVPQLTMIERFDEPEALKALENSVVTILSLLTDNDNEVPATGAVFNTDALHDGDKDVHFVTTTTYMQGLYKKLEAENKRYAEIAASLNTKSTFGNAEGADDESGMVF